MIILLFIFGFLDLILTNVNVQKKLRFNWIIGRIIAYPVFCIFIYGFLVRIGYDLFNIKGVAKDIGGFLMLFILFDITMPLGVNYQNYIDIFKGTAINKMDGTSGNAGGVGAGTGGQGVPENGAEGPHQASIRIPQIDQRGHPYPYSYGSAPGSNILNVDDPDNQATRGYDRYGSNQPLLKNIADRMLEYRKVFKGKGMQMSPGMFTMDQERFYIDYLRDKDRVAYLKLLRNGGTRVTPNWGELNMSLEHIKKLRRRDN